MSDSDDDSDWVDITNLENVLPDLQFRVPDGGEALLVEPLSATADTCSDLELSRFTRWTVLPPQSSGSEWAITFRLGSPEEFAARVAQFERRRRQEQR